MTNIPGGREVEQALRSAERAVKVALKGVNQQAGKLLARGDYPGAETMVGVGRSVDGFCKEVEALRQRWRSLRVVPPDSPAGAGDTTPLWEYYRPILRTLDKLGGEATRHEIEQHVESELLSTLNPGDKRSMARGKPRWAIMVKRARKYLVREGFLESRAGLHWRITAAGRQAVQKDVLAAQGDDKRD